MLITISLPANRQKYGTLTCGDFTAACCAQSDLMAAIKAGNPSRDALKPYGNTPLGRYRGNLGSVLQPERSYGPHRVIELHPIDGDALHAAKNGRDGFLIHGGDLAPDGINLRPTHGCVRLSNRDMQFLLDILEAANAPAFTVSIEQAA